MQLPTISQYAGSVADPAGLTRTLGEFGAERDNYGELKIRTGNNACVFRILEPSPARMLKCYIRPRSDLAAIYKYISESDDVLFHGIRLLPRELFVFDHFGRGEYYDVVCGNWAEGPNLDTEIRRACREGDAGRLGALSRSFDRLAGRILGREWAHGDLKPENIIVGPDDTLTLIDFDALYFPGNPEPSYLEVGTPGYQHPARTETLYEKCIDDYPLALISVSLRALSLEPDLYARFNRSDILLMNPAGILSGTCPSYEAVKELLSGSGCLGHYMLSLLLSSPTPELRDIAGTFARLNTPLNIDGNPAVYMADGLYGYLDALSGIPLTDPVFEEACDFRDGIALVSLGGRRRLMSRRGEFLFDRLGYDDIKPYCGGAAAFRVDGRWGYADALGNEVVEPRFEAAGNMHEGSAPVMCGGKWAYIDRDGEFVTGFIFDKALGFRGGRADVFMDGEMVIIDTEGNIIGRKDR